MNQRYYSLDIFRGATVALMILVNNPGTWSHIYPPLKHASWHGCTPTDLVFPFFLFAVGNAMSFVMPRLEKAGTSAFFKKIIKRTLLIFLIGLFLNWWPFVAWKNNELIWKSWENARILGVLQRIALCYFFASIIVYFCKTKGAFFISVVILLFYWFICWAFGASGDPYSLEGFFGNSFDVSILENSHMYRPGIPFDPEGLASTLPAIVQVIFGYFVGQYIQQKGKNYEMLSNLFVAGIVLAFTGLCWDMAFPINKQMWTSSYVLYTSGLAILTISVVIFLVEFKGAKGAWSKFFDVFGRNPLFIFAFSGFLPRLLGLIRIPQTSGSGEITYTSPLPWFYDHVCKPIFNEDLKAGSLLYSICFILVFWLIAWFLDKKKIYIKV